MTGQILVGRYELKEVIGQGGMAIVYRALDRTLARQVAVKVLREQLAADPEIVERFDREAKSAAQLAHPNVVDIYDVGAENGTRFIVMQLVEGGNLKDLLRRRGGPLPPGQVLRYGREVAAALDFAHRRGLVHRDVKPQNVLLDAEGQARLADFGIAQAVDKVSMTVTGTVLGTAHYMAPEQARGRSAGPLSDIYSLGVLLYELATGRLPFDGDNALAIALRHVDEEPIPPRQLNPSVPVGLEAVILRAMAKDPARRFASAAELASALAGEIDPVRERTVRVAVVEPRTAVARPASARPRVQAPPPFRADPPARPRPMRPDQRQQRGRGLGLLFVLVLISLGALALGFGWLFGAGRIGALTTPAASPTLISAPTTAPAPPLAPATAIPTPRQTALAATAAPTPTQASTPTALPLTPTLAPTPAPSPAPIQVAVPRLVGLSLGQAQQELSNRGLAMLFSDGNDSKQPDNVILSQDPKDGQQVAQRSPVRLVVNKLATTSVPNVQGLEEQGARQALEAAGLRTVVERASGGRKGVVNDQSPQPGVKVAPGTDVRIVIGS